MSDEIDEDLLKELGELDGDADGTLTTIGSTATTSATAGGGRGRFVGLLALVLGLVGSLLMVLFAALSVRFGFSASDTVDRAMQPVQVAFDRMEARIDETDDLVDRDGIEADRIDELQARADGLVDVSTGAHQVFEAIEDHPIYSLLPAELSNLGSALADFEASSTTVDSLLGDASNGDELRANAVNGVADELDDMQSRVSGVRAMISDASASLRRWMRFGSLLGFIGSLWGLWGQVQLARRGWRGFRGRDL